jgi:hypothetical protein
MSELIQQSFGNNMTALVDTWTGVKAQIDSLYESKGRLEMAMEQMMGSDNAEEFQHGGFLVTLKADSLWVEAMLEDLTELIVAKGLDPDEFLSKPVARKFDKRKLTKLAKQGGAIREVIENAKVLGAPVLKVKKS